MRITALTFLACFVLSLSACEKISVPTEQEQQKQTEDNGQQNGNEKYCYGVDLPRSDKHYDSIAAGDLMLYSGNCVVLFYGSAGGYSYTRIGKLTSTDGLKEALGTGNISVTFAKQ